MLNFGPFKGPNECLVLGWKTAKINPFLLDPWRTSPWPSTHFSLTWKAFFSELKIHTKNTIFYVKTKYVIIFIRSCSQGLVFNLRIPLRVVLVTEKLSSHSCVGFQCLSQDVSASRVAAETLPYNTFGPKNDRSWGPLYFSLHTRSHQCNLFILVPKYYIK